MHSNIIKPKVCAYQNWRVMKRKFLHSYYQFFKHERTISATVMCSVVHNSQSKKQEDGKTFFVGRGQGSFNFIQQCCAWLRICLSFSTTLTIREQNNVESVNITRYLLLGDYDHIFEPILVIMCNLLLPLKAG